MKYFDLLFPSLNCWDPSFFLLLKTTSLTFREWNLAIIPGFGLELVGWASRREILISLLQMLTPILCASSIMSSSVQVCTFHDGCKQAIDQQIFNRKSISRKSSFVDSSLVYGMTWNSRHGLLLYCLSSLTESS